MTCTFWQSRQAQCGRAAVATIGTTLALCGVHDSAFHKGIQTLPTFPISMRERRRILGYQEIA